MCKWEGKTWSWDNNVEPTHQTAAGWSTKPTAGVKAADDCLWSTRAGTTTELLTQLPIVLQQQQLHALLLLPLLLLLLTVGLRSLDDSPQITGTGTTTTPLQQLLLVPQQLHVLLLVLLQQLHHVLHFTTAADSRS